MRFAITYQFNGHTYKAPWKGHSRAAVRRKFNKVFPLGKVLQVVPIKYSPITVYLNSLTDEIMTQLEALELLEQTRADYVAMCRDLHGLKKLQKPFDTGYYPLIERLDKAIKSLRGAFPERKQTFDPRPLGTLAHALHEVKK